MTIYADPEPYEAELAPRLRNLDDKTQITFAFQCVERCLVKWNVFDPPGTNVGRALKEVERWLNDLPMENKFLSWDKVLARCQQNAVEAYNAIEKGRTIHDASDEGIEAYCAGHAVEAVTFLLSAIDDPERRSEICAEAVASAWMASLHSLQEKKWQLDLLSTFERA